MQKTGLKTFAYSFSVSLFAIFVANGVYWHEHPSKTPEIKIPSKNITLFLKSDATPPSNAQVPVKKIALSVLPDVKLDTPLAEPDDEIIMADDFNLPEIPLEFSLPPLDTQMHNQQKLLSLAENATPPPQEIYRATEDIERPDKIVIPLQIPESIDVPRAPKEKEKAFNDDVLVSDVFEHEQEEPSPIGIQMAASNISLDETADVPTLPLDLPQKTEEVPLLPLEKGGKPHLYHQNIVKVAQNTSSDQVALADKNIPIHSMDNIAPSSNNPKQQAPTSDWKSMSEKTAPSGTDSASPWLVAKADGALTNKKIAEEPFYHNDKILEKPLMANSSSQSGVKLASETVKNLLIPIPEDILNDENLTPQLSYTPKKDASDKASPNDKLLPLGESDTTQEIATKEPSSTEKTDNQKNKLLSSLDALFSTPSSVTKEKEETNSGILDKLRIKKQRSSAGKIMPTEMRLSFQPNRAEISGQTLRWIQAFAAKAAENNNMSIEIRIDGTGAMDLQQKRLNLLHNILANKGVQYSKINTVFTQREPNSFIIKTITHKQQEGANRNLNKAANGYYIPW